MRSSSDADAEVAHQRAERECSAHAQEWKKALGEQLHRLGFQEISAKTPTLKSFNIQHQPRSGE